MGTDASNCELCTPNDVIFENALAYVRYDSNFLGPGHGPVGADSAPSST